MAASRTVSFRGSVIGKLHFLRSRLIHKKPCILLPGRDITQLPCKIGRRGQCWAGRKQTQSLRWSGNTQNTANNFLLRKEIGPYICRSFCLQRINFILGLLLVYNWPHMQARKTSESARYSPRFPLKQTVLMQWNCFIVLTGLWTDPYSLSPLFF